MACFSFFSFSFFSIPKSYTTSERKVLCGIVRLDYYE